MTLHNISDSGPRTLSFDFAPSATSPQTPPPRAAGGADLSLTED